MASLSSAPSSLATGLNHAPGDSSMAAANKVTGKRTRIADDTAGASGVLDESRAAPGGVGTSDVAGMTSTGASAGKAGSASGAKRGSGTASRPRVKKTPEQQRADRRERNRRHARCSRARKKLLIDTLQTCIKSLQTENSTMRGHISGRFGEEGLESLMAVHGNAFDNRTKGDSLDTLIAPQGAAADGVSGKLILERMNASFSQSCLIFFYIQLLNLFFSTLLLIVRAQRFSRSQTLRC